MSKPQSQVKFGRALVTLALMQVLAMIVFKGLFHLLEDLIKVDLISGAAITLIGAYIGAYVCGLWLEKKNPQLLEPIIKRLALYCTWIYVIANVLFIGPVVYDLFKTATPGNNMPLEILGVSVVLVLITGTLYYIASRWALKRGMKIAQRAEQKSAVKA